MGLRRAPLAVLALIALVLAACGSTPSAAGTPNSTTSTAPPSNALVLENGGTVTVAVPHLPPVYNPSTPQGQDPVTAMVMAQVLPQVFTVNDRGQPTAAVGQTGVGLTVSAEVTSIKPQVVTYVINKDARWSDGVPITAADFIYNWHHRVAIGSRLSSSDDLSGYKDIRSIVGSDGGKTVTVTFAQDYADWEALFSNLIPAHIGRKFGWVSGFSTFDPTKVISGGPFEITSVDPGVALVLSRNPRYWGPQARLAHIVFRVEHGDDATIHALESGAVDIAELLPSNALNRLVALSESLVDSTNYSDQLWQLAFNVSDPAVSNQLVREAIAKVLDRQQILTNTIGEETSFGSVPGNRLSIPGGSGTTGNDEAFQVPNVAEAHALLAVVGYSVSSDGLVVDKNGVPLRLTLVAPSQSPLAAAIALQLRAQLLGAGIELEVQYVSADDLLSTVLPEGQYELALAPYLISFYLSSTSNLYAGPPVVMESTTSSDAAAGIASAAAGAVARNILGFSDPVITSLFVQASTELNPTTADGLYNEIDTRLWQDLPTLPLLETPTTLVSRVDLVNVSNSPTPAGPLWDAEDWAIQINPPPTVPSTPGG